MNTDTYFHLNSQNYSLGEIILPGSMGSMIYTNYILYGNENERGLIWRLFQEQTFELIRIKYYPDKPSRYKSIFLFESINEAQKFYHKDKREGSNLFEVEILKNKMIHRGCMKLYERIPHGRPVLPAIEDQAHQYWKGINTIDSVFETEILVESPVRIIRIISNE